MKTFLSILVALGIPAAFWNYYLKEVPDVQYSISTSIPLAFEEASSVKRSKNEYVQQIEVANSGKGEARKIVIKLSGPISQFYLSKHSASEEPFISNNADGFELSYPSLPPSAGFQLTVKTNTDLTARQVDVFHQAGRARFVSPGVKRSEFGLADALWFGVPILYFFLMYSSFRDGFRYRYLFQRYSSGIAELLRNEKPWYIRRSDWPEVLNDLITRAITTQPSIYSTVTGWPQYVVLNSERPTDLTPSIWEELKETASKRLLDALKLKARQASSGAEIYDLLSLQWPGGISETNRESAIKALSANYIEYLVTSSSTDDLVRILSSDDKPSMIPTESWERFKDKAETEVVKAIVEKVFGTAIISIETLPEWRVLSTHNRWKLSTLKELQSKAQEADEKLELARRLSDRADTVENKILLREAEAKTSENRNQELCKKVLRQLDVINKLIADPSYIDQIESYDDTFAPGNWKLLRKLVSVASCDDKHLNA